jgi:flagellar hook-associated protein 3 FlgL
MRITQQMMHGNILRNVNTNLEKLNETQQQISTGKVMKRPSDDPLAFEQSVNYRQTLSSNEQYKRNTNKAITAFDEMDMALNQGLTIMHRVRELTVQGANGTIGVEEREKIATEIDQLAKQIREVANLNVNGNYLFNGQKTDIAPFSNTAPFTANDAGTGKVSIEVSRGLKMPLNLEASEAFGKTGESIFDTLYEISDKLRNGTTAEISNTLGKLDENTDHMLGALADVGARKNRVELIENRIDEQQINVTRLLSNVEDVNIAEAVMNMKMQEQVYQASLSSSSKIMQMSLMDYLR